MRCSRAKYCHVCTGVGNNRQPSRNDGFGGPTRWFCNHTLAAYLANGSLRLKDVEIAAYVRSFNCNY